jgi:hypothetical protein
VDASPSPDSRAESVSEFGPSTNNLYTSVTGTGRTASEGNIGGDISWLVRSDNSYTDYPAGQSARKRAGTSELTDRVDPTPFGHLVVNQ